MSAKAVREIFIANEGKKVTTEKIANELGIEKSDARKIIQNMKNTKFGQQLEYVNPQCYIYRGDEEATEVVPEVEDDNTSAFEEGKWFVMVGRTASGKFVLREDETDEVIIVEPVEV